MPNANTPTPCRTRQLSGRQDNNAVTSNTLACSGTAPSRPSPNSPNSVAHTRAAAPRTGSGCATAA